MTDLLVRSRALVLHGPGDLRVEDVPVVCPGPGEVLVNVAYGGICGSDLHYAIHGRGSFSVVSEPLILGHELSATVAALGPGTEDFGLAVGTAVAINPAANCGNCPDCRHGRPQTCRDTRYLGSAATKPHVQGGLVQQLAVRAELAVPLPPGVDLVLGALAEPFAVAVHAIRRAGNLAGARVLVTGAGPVGLLAAVAAKAAGAAQVTITDLQPFALTLANAIGISSVIDTSSEPGHQELAAAHHSFDVAIEAAGAVPALHNCMDAVRSGGTIVQLGMLPMSKAEVPVSQMMQHELTYLTSLRFGFEFPQAVQLLGEHPELRQLVTHQIPLEQAADVIKIAQDRSAASKVMIQITNGDNQR